MAKATVSWFEDTSTNITTTGALWTRALWGLIVELQGAGVIVHWSDDRTPTGTSIWFATKKPHVEVLTQGTADRRSFDQQMMCGPMYNPEDPSEYGWQTTWNTTNSLWQTEIFRKGDPDREGGAQAQSNVLCIVIGRGRN